MNTDTIVEEVKASLLKELEVDFDDLASIYYYTKVFLCDSNACKAKQATLEAVRQLLDEGRIRAGWLSAEEGFVPWLASASVAFARIAREWEELDQEIRRCDIAWFDKSLAPEA